MPALPIFLFPSLPARRPSGARTLRHGRSRSRGRGLRRGRFAPLRLVCVAGLLALLHASPTIAAEEAATDGATEGKGSPFLRRLMDAIVGGKPILDVRFRVEHGKIDGFQTSWALTARTRLGYQTKPLHGVSGLLEFENVATPSGSLYFDGVETNQSDQTIVADPEVIQANRFWLRLAREDWLGLDLKVGRQRIKLDDDRWVGNVGWRQNEQTFDAVRVQSDLGVDGLLAQYVFTWEVNRIFGDRGPASTRDFGQESHFAQLGYAASKVLNATAFAYLIDANDPFSVDSSHTYGLRLTGTAPLSDALAGSYQASYAYQTDAADNPVDYAAHYLFLEAGLALSPIGGIAVGYELLGTDDGDARVITPFATAHKFNGFADAFLDNGGVRGLRDVFASVSPRIPWDGASLKLIYHRFWDDQGGDDLGREVDLVTSYRLNEYVTFLYKFAWYDEGGRRSPESRIRNVVETTVRF